ncbi:MAG: S8 family serine peptidase, partial [Lachnospiraceae bacterium]|nr:S8 family serine peptidase [Lachnospiraceae bacterium]
MNKRIVASLLTAVVVFAQSPFSYVQAADDASGASEPEQSLGEELLPAGIPGLPEDYVLPESEMDEKKEMMEHDVLEALGSMTADEDYCSDLVYTYAETEEEAIAYAEAFNGTLTVYSEKIATIKLPSDVSVLQAVSAASDPACTKLPSVSPVYISYLDPGEKEDSGDSLYSVGASSDSSVLSYKDFIAKGYADDPFLQNPEELYNDNDKQFQWQHDMVNTWEAWTYGYGNPDIKVGVLDTGVLVDHEDLKDNVIDQYDFCSYDNSDNSLVVDPHGTHVAGIIGASINNGKGGAGIAPGVSLYSYNVFTQKNGSYADDQARAIKDCADKGIDIINMSLGGKYFDVERQKSINYAWEKGVTIFVAMGNEYTSIRKYPTCFEHVLSVSNLSRDGLRSYSSNYGPWCDLAAPGTDIISPVCVFNGSTLTTTTNAYDSYTGTSMSCPVAAGVAALYMSRYGNPGPKQMEKLLKKYSRKCDSEGCGVLVDAGKLMAGGGTPEPVISLYTEYGYFKVDDTKYDYDDVTGFSLSDPLKSTGPLSRTLVYTLDGDDPTLEDHVPYSESVNLLSSGFASGSKVTIKAAILDETGKIGDVSSLDVELLDDYVVEVENKVKKANIILNGDTSKKPVTKYTMSYSGDSYKDCVSFNALLYTASSNKLISLDEVEHEWSTSDPSTLFLEEKEDGTLYVYPVKDGKAKINLKLLDGSRKTAVCNINIKQLVTGL